MYCCRNTWHTGKSKMSSAKIADLPQETNSFIIGEENTVLCWTWSQLQVVRIWWLYHSGTLSHLNTRWTKCLQTKLRAEPALTNFYKHVKSQSTYHLNETAVPSRISTTFRFICSSDTTTSKKKKIPWLKVGWTTGKRIHILLDNCLDRPR